MWTARLASSTRKAEPLHHNHCRRRHHHQHHRAFCHCHHHHVAVSAKHLGAPRMGSLCSGGCGRHFCFDSGALSSRRSGQRPGRSLGRAGCLWRRCGGCGVGGRATTTAAVPRLLRKRARFYIPLQMASAPNKGARLIARRTHSTPPPSPSLLRPRRGGLERSSPRPETISQVPGESGLAPALEPPWVRTRFSIPKHAFVAIASWSSLAILLHGCAEIAKQFGDPRSWPPCYDNGLGVNLMLKWWRLSQGSRPRAESAGGACFSWRRFCCRAARIFGSSHVARACLARTSWTEL